MAGGGGNGGGGNGPDHGGYGGPGDSSGRGASGGAGHSAGGGDRGGNGNGGGRSSGGWSATAYGGYSPMGPEPGRQGPGSMAPGSGPGRGVSEGGFLGGSTSFDRYNTEREAWGLDPVGIGTPYGAATHNTLASFLGDWARYGFGLTGLIGAGKGAAQRARNQSFAHQLSLTPHGVPDPTRGGDPMLWYRQQPTIGGKGGR